MKKGSLVIKTNPTDDKKSKLGIVLSWSGCSGIFLTVPSGGLVLWQGESNPSLEYEYDIKEVKL